VVPPVATEKIPSDTTGTVRLVAQCLNHYTTPRPYVFGKFLIFLFFAIVVRIYHLVVLVVMRSFFSVAKSSLKAAAVIIRESLAIGQRQMAGWLESQII
jgi:hypothetical protein